MHRTILAFALAGAAGAFIAAPASAVTCYRLLDRNDNVVYQDIYPPVDDKIINGPRGRRKGHAQNHTAAPLRRSRVTLPKHD